MDSSDNENDSFSMFSKRTKRTKTENDEQPQPRQPTMKQVVVKPESERCTFGDLGLNEWVVRSVNSMGIITPTPVQVCFS